MGDTGPLAELKRCGADPAGSAVDQHFVLGTKMAEVVKHRSSRRLESCYYYPNSEMHQPDEKQQQNQFVSELLSLCLSEAHADGVIFEVGNVD